ncbi:Na+/H+ antiporter NhaC [Paraglaciecola arctica]|uniref:Na+:H+ antiporter, NhaC family n=1 Tax=Paraglaciecola arctica BSs20135 TaxID=493475 RepID=K6YVW7_9ALTE|nr:Na+/H+ antiporter NhaC [Paraglaciecola arctica]GAC22297.1 Na+:H+ antiporter, NhaC family [Paraglaciecola arctica BSs20135]|tara:strand:- start:2824 stop:4332 length:1509 start_codon:yes stop_codon:yes gene_type:complete
MLAHPKKPTLFDALIPISVLLILLFLAVYFFGDDSSSGPNQIALLLCAGIATLVGLKNGYKRKEIEEGIVKGISLTLGAILILLAVGSLIGTWLLAGTVPSMIYFGLQILEPQYFYISCSIICALVALCIGSSWTVAATIGVALMGVATGIGASGPITAGAIISGAYFGDKLSPLSDTTNLAPAIAGTDLFVHIKNMLWSTIPSFVITLVIFFFLGLNSGEHASSKQIEQLLVSLENEFFIAWYLLLPLVFTLTLAVRKIPAFPAIGLGAIMGAIWAVLFQQDLILSYAHDGLSLIETNIKVVWQAMYAGVTLNTGNEVIDKLLSGGGMGSMLNTIWLIISAMTFGSIMEKIGLLERIVKSLMSVTKSTGALISTTIVTAFGTNCIAADQYIAIVMPGRMFKEEYRRRGLAPENLSRALEDGGTVTSPLIPWNTCAAYMQSVLLINPLEYAMYCFFNWLSPIIGIACALIGFKVKALVVPAKEATTIEVSKKSINSLETEVV